MDKQVLWALCCFLTVAVVTGGQGGVPGRCSAQCSPEKCEEPPVLCPAGLVRDRCDCCMVCGQQEGHRCDMEVANDPNNDFKNGYEPIYGRCGEMLECRMEIDEETPNSVTRSAMCVCEEHTPVCGEDRRTYSTKCNFREMMAGRREQVRMAKNGPCDEPPVIIHGPEDVTEPTGGNIVLSCEVIAYPSPRIEWQLTRGDGMTIMMPSDDSRKSVQARGGPDHLHMTGWLYMTNVDNTDSGVYTCIAKNKFGKATAEARVTVQKKNEL